jgi:hypothetical protein
MMLAGHSLVHIPHPTQRSLSMTAWMPFGMVIAFRGQTFIQHPQATQSWILTTAFFLVMIKLLLLFYRLRETVFFIVYRQKVFCSVMKSQNCFMRSPVRRKALHGARGE